MLAVGLALSGCAEASESKSASGEKAAKLVDVPGSDVKQVVLTARAIQRLDIQTKPVTEEPAGKVVPYGAVVYDPNGNTWVYTSPAPLTFVRTPVTVGNIIADRAILTAGPAAGTGVVTTGTAELYGIENEVGH